MRKRIYHYPIKRWVQDTVTGLWHSRERTRDEIITAKSAISAMTFVPYSEITWIPQHHQFVVYMP